MAPAAAQPSRNAVERPVIDGFRGWWTICPALRGLRGYAAAVVSDIIHLSPPMARSTHGEYWNPMKVVVPVVAARVLTKALLDPATRADGRLALAPDSVP